MKSRTTTETQHWNTPPDFLDRVRMIGPIALDPCSNAGSVVNAQVEIFASAPESLRLNRKHFFDVIADGLEIGWTEVYKKYSLSGLVFVNPPYGKISPWVDKCIKHAAEGLEIVLLVPGRTDPVWAHNAMDSAACVLFWLGRIAFLRDGIPQRGADFGPAVYYWGPHQYTFRAAFGECGTFLRK